jgi:hypothetical protein
MIIKAKREMNLELRPNAENNGNEKEMKIGELQLVKFFQSSYKSKKNLLIQGKKLRKQTKSNFNIKKVKMK